MKDRKHLHAPRSLGERAADSVATATGSWRFIFSYMALTLIWMGGNTMRVASFDPYPFILYTCAVSVLAILMSSIIMLSQNRQAAKDRQRDDHEAEEVAALFEMQNIQMEILRKHTLHLEDIVSSNNAMLEKVVNGCSL